MALFMGDSASITQEREYVDARSETAQHPFRYVMRYRPTGVVPTAGDPCTWTLPFSPGWAEGGDHLSTPKLRIGEGLSRQRGRIRPATQLVNPVRFHLGNGDRCAVKTSTRLRNGYREVRRGVDRPSMVLNSGVGFHQGQTPAPTFTSTVERGRCKDVWATQPTASYIAQFAPSDPQRIEEFSRGGVSTRCGTDFSLN